ncbi:SprT family protein [Viridibacillus sp. YIM B01967]|uniref:Protein SprT-like n=1 Tax=Viridibacillus soli TaxID=2798301 RepID=A0ABS1H545_9BACL|nr:SprT family protein [Viridibacillus soli]MBK3494505.1 SprT family protein [Viridibacillus soli]
MNDTELQILVSKISTEVFQKPFAHQAYFNKRLRTTGGRYLLRSHNIEINPKAFEKHGILEVEGIIRHELCHYHLHIEGKGYQHRDADFRKLLKKTNAPRFCSNLTEPNRRTSSKSYTYMCIKCGINYIRKIRMNPAKYRCSKCSGHLKQIE